MMKQLDNYTLKARLYPSFLVLLPAFVVCVYYITDFEKYYHYFTAVISIGLFTFLLSQLGRDKGKLKEPELHKYFGGKPTTQILRYRDVYIDNVTKERYRKLLINKIEGLQFPSAEQERIEADQADQVYESCAKFLISKTRDTVKFNLLFKENISYGFRRNLWGMKLWAILVLFCCFLLHYYFATQSLTIFNHYSAKDIGLFCFLIATTIFWVFIITKNWVRLPAFAYAERLFEALNEL